MDEHEVITAGSCTKEIITLLVRARGEKNEQKRVNGAKNATQHVISWIRQPWNPLPSVYQFYSQDKNICVSVLWKISEQWDDPHQLPGYDDKQEPVVKAWVVEKMVEQNHIQWTKHLENMWRLWNVLETEMFFFFGRTYFLFTSGISIRLSIFKMWKIPPFIKGEGCFPTQSTLMFKPNNGYTKTKQTL